MTGSAASLRSDEHTPQLRYRVEAVALEDPLDLAAARALAAPDTSPGEPVFFWQHPERDEAMVGVGSACDLVADGSDRIGRVADDARRCLAAMRAIGEPIAGVVPRVVGGFSFAPGARHGAWREFPEAWFFVPRHLWIWRRGRCHRIDVEGGGPRAPRSTVPTPDAGIPEARSAFLDRVATALGMIERGALDKVVLSRQRRIEGLRPSLPRTLRALRDTRPGCVTFAVKPGSSVLLGSTPELMVRREGDRFTAPALAGTMPRGADPAADALNARTLASCDKNRREHRAVADGIRDALSRLDVVLDPPTPVRLVTLPEAFHLRTSIAGRSDLDVLALAEALHPTPAVCGTPTAAAARLLQATERERGWYTGGVGWMDARGDGEVVVALRSALVARGDVTLSAGAGVVRGSEPQAELAETEVKMAALLAALRTARAPVTRDEHGAQRSCA